MIEDWGLMMEDNFYTVIARVRNSLGNLLFDEKITSSGEYTFPAMTDAVTSYLNVMMEVCNNSAEQMIPPPCLRT